MWTRFSNLLLRSAAVASAGLLLSACGKPAQEGGEAASLKACIEQSEQKESFQPPIEAGFPVKISIDTQFTTEERADIMRAVHTWNEFGLRMQGKPFFETETLMMSGDSGPNHAEDCTFKGGSESSFSIIRESDKKRWDALHLESRNPAVNIRCTNDSKKLVRQVILINVVDLKPSQMMSVALHELGHSIGLDHSCSTNGANPAYVSCKGLQPEHPYRVAVMYPALRIGTSSTDLPELKEELKANDMERASCLYIGI